MHPHHLEQGRVYFFEDEDNRLINNRQAGRRRGRGGQRSQGGNPGRGPESGNRIDNRARGNASQLLEKYKALARDAQMQGDRVNTEYYLQFADHYFRVLSESRSRFDENQNRRPQNDQFDDADDEEFDGESLGEDAREGQFNGNRQGREQQHYQNRDQNRYGNRDGGRGEARGDGRGPRENGAFEQGRDRSREQGEQPFRDNGGRDPAPAPEMAQPRGEAVERFAEDAAPVERPRRGRPRREPVEPVGREAAGRDSVAIDADRLPPALSVATGDDEPAEKPRRRRGRPPAGDAAAAD